MKDHLRDYCTEAFRFYARNGMSSEKYKQMIYEQAMEEHKKREAKTGFSNPTEAAIMAAERAVEEKISAILDMEAVELTMAELWNEGRTRDIAEAVKIVYFTDANNELSRGDIQDRVHIAEINLPTSDRNVYRYLRKARDMFAEKRGLRK